MRSVGEIVAARYRVVRQIAEGGMGVLFEAVHISLEERVAIKFVRAAELGPDAIPRFEREARLAVKLRSEHVARVLDAGRDETGDPFIVMEYLEGVDVGHLVRTNGPLGVPLAADYLVQACHGLAEAHALTIVHRDVKPGNLFLTEDAAGLPIIKVLDFGISKAVDGGGDELTASPERAVQLLGTPHYVSPEQLLTPHEVDARADIWSLGVCAWVMATGTLPFSQRDLILLFANILSTPAASIATVRPDLPEPFVRAIDRCLQKDRADRFRDVGELAAALGSMTSARIRPLVKHTSLLLERGRARAAAAGERPRSTPSASELAADATLAEGQEVGAGAVATSGAVGPAADAGEPSASSSWILFTERLVPGRVGPSPPSPPPTLPSPSWPPPSLPPPARGVPLIVGALVVGVAAAIVVVVGMRVLPRLRHPPGDVTPLPSSVAEPSPQADLPGSDAPSVAPAAVTAAGAGAASVAPKRVPLARPAQHRPGEGAPAPRGVPSTRE